MTRHLNLKHPVFYLGIPIVLIGSIVFLLMSSWLPVKDTVYLAITADLLLTIPLVYFLLIRKTAIPKTTVIPFMILGIVVGTYLLPTEGQTYLNLFKTWALPVIELCVLGFAIFQVIQARIEYNLVKNTNSDFYDTVKAVCKNLFPSTAASLVTTEIAVFYYGFVNWKKRKLEKNEFSYHRESGTPAMLGAFIFIIGVETYVLHILLVNWSPLFAWILSGLSIYTGLQVLGIAKSISKRPIRLSTNSLILNSGIMNTCEIEFSDIESVEYSTKSFDKNSGIKRLSPLGEIESHNIILMLKNENTLIGMYGLKRSFQTLALFVDKPNEFKEKLESLIS